MRWVLHSLSLKAMCVCALAVEIKEFKCLPHGITALCCRRDRRNKGRTAPSLQALRILLEIGER